MENQNYIFNLLKSDNTIDGKVFHLLTMLAESKNKELSSVARISNISMQMREYSTFPLG